MNIQWDANTYTEKFHFVHQYGRKLFGLLDEIKGKTVIDLGCGNGALTKQLSDMGANVIGMDASAKMLEIARMNYPKLCFMQMDATEFSVNEKVDIVFSNAVLHWIEKERQMNVLYNIADSLKVGGVFVCEFGGACNNAKIHHALAEVFANRGLAYKMPFYFPTIGEYAPLLEKVGLKVQYATLFDRLTELGGEDGLAEWIKMFVKRPFENVSDDKANDMIQEAIALLKPDLYQNKRWYADYVRIRFRAMK